jgi:hypothetical protein
MRGLHNPGDTYKLALYKESASLNSATTRYLTAGEISGTGYSAGGSTLTTYAAVLDGGNSILDFHNIVWTASTFSTGGCQIYNDSVVSKPTLGVFNFGTAKQVSAGTFTVQFPAAATGSAVMEIAV